jgi:hypothetical protein
MQSKSMDNPCSREFELLPTVSRTVCLGIGPPLGQVTTTHVEVEVEVDVKLRPTISHSVFLIF